MRGISLFPLQLTTGGIALVLDAVKDGLQWFISGLTPAFIWAVLGIAVCIAAFSYYWVCLKPRPHSLEWIEMSEAKSKPKRFSFTLPYHPMTKADIVPVIVLTLAYALTAFFQLGNTKSPQTWQSFDSYVYVSFQSDTPVEIGGVGWFAGLDTGNYALEVSMDGEHWTALRLVEEVWDGGTYREKQPGEDTTGMSTREAYYWTEEAPDATIGSTVSFNQGYNTVFKWHKITETNGATVTGQYFRLTGKPDTSHPPMEMGEMVFYGANGEKLEFHPQNGAYNLFDEQDLVPEHSTYMDSTYFDEIYHPRTAYENLNHIYPYEASHPPLGKLIIALGITIFGMTPFGWRFMGTLFGVLMVPILYIFLKNLFGKTNLAICGACLFTFDFMHLVQTRIATIDTYGVIFILLSYYFFYRWLAVPAGKPFRKYLIPLSLSGILWGIGCASKWTVVYAGIGLAVMWLIGVIFRGLEWHRLTHLTAEEAAAAEIDAKAEAKKKAKSKGKRVDKPDPKPMPYPQHVICTVLASILVFVILPVCIYTCSYFPYATARGNEGSFLDMAGESLAWPATKLPEYLQTASASITPEDGLGDRATKFFNAIPTNDNPVDIMMKNQYFMFTYHQGVHDAHPYQSYWYQWIFDARPILYYRDLDFQSVNGTKSLFASFNNPLVSWMGLAAFFVVIYQTIRRKSGTGLFIVISILSQFVPWLGIGRTLFAYHYFPTVLFLTFAISYMLNDMLERKRKGYRQVVYGFTGCVVALYAVFYPALIGIYMPTWYAELFLRWFPSWPL